LRPDEIYKKNGNEKKILFRDIVYKNINAPWQKFRVYGRTLRVILTYHFGAHYPESWHD